MVELLEGHRHLRTTLELADGTALVFQEATVVTIVRAYRSIKTHPTATRIVLRGRPVAERKEDFSEWQLLEE